MAVFRGGAGSGKTYAGVAWALTQAIRKPGSHGMIMAANYPQFDQAIMPILLDMAAQTTLSDYWKFNKASNRIELPNGSVFWLRSADKAMAPLGANLTWLWGDEVALWKRDAWTYVTSRLRETGLGHSRQIAVTFTPKGRNWAWKTFGADDRPDIHVVHATSQENPYLPEDFFELQRNEYGEGSQTWNQEILGEYVAWEGLIYSTFSVEKHVAEPPARETFASMVLGVDWGWTNPGVILVVGVTGGGTVWVLDELHQRERSIDWWASRARELQTKHGATTAYCDPSEPANIAALQHQGVGAQGAANARIPGITAVGGRIANNNLMIAPHCTQTIAEFGMYCWKQKADGTVKADEPEKANDHAMDALRYAMMGLHTPVEFEMTVGMAEVFPTFQPVEMEDADI